MAAVGLPGCGAAWAQTTPNPFNAQVPQEAHLNQPWFPDVASARRYVPYTLDDAFEDVLSLMHVLEAGAPALVTPFVNRLPACGSDFAVESNRNAYDGAIDTSIAADTFLKMLNIKQTGSARGERDCVADMVLFGGTVRVTHYRLLQIGSYVAVDVRVDPPR